MSKVPSGINHPTSKVWYNNLNVLLKEPLHFFPCNSDDRIEKINTLARFAIYYAIVIILSKSDTKWLSVSAVILATTYCMGQAEHFTIEQEDSEQCTRPTKENPFMNFTVGDHYNNPQKPEACPHTDEIKKDMRQKFLMHEVSDPNDIWGNNINDRQFMTMPNTRSVNNQKDFALWLYGDIGKCKSEGVNCLKNIDNRYHIARSFLHY